MRILTAVLLTFASGPAFAMNWEGHDDWMAGMEPAQIYEDAAPHAVPRPSRECEAKPAGEQASNPYEQIPLPRHACPEHRPGREAER